ncbi:MAG: M1 family peptidase, partial [Moraxellaceae bacterium]
MTTPQRAFLLTFLSFFLFAANTSGQQNYWQQEVNHVISVSLNDTDHTLTAQTQIEYINNSPDELTFIWFHLWPNAYKDRHTAMAKQMVRNGSSKFYFAKESERGYIDGLDFKINGQAARLEAHPEFIDVTKLWLNEPLKPGQKITIPTPFTVKLPGDFSRLGHDGQSYQITQWYPKPAVYDRKGWHEMPYLDQGEFYSEFGKFDVSITLPDNYV